MFRVISRTLPAGLLVLSACGAVYDKKLDGPYRLVAIDVMEDMTVCLGLDDNICAGIGLPEGAVFAAGANDQFIAIALHPQTWPKPPDRSITRYYYLVRDAEEDKGVVGAMQGPFDALQFDKERRRRGLPAFSHVFDELK